MYLGTLAKLNALGIVVAMLIGGASLSGCNDAKKQQSAELEEAIIKATGSTLVPFGEFSFFHGANFEAGMFLACDKKIYDVFRDGLFPEKKHPSAIIPDYRCDTATKDSAVTPVLFFMNPPHSDADEVNTSVTLQLEDPSDPTGSSDLKLVSFQISNNKKYYPKNRHVLGPKITAIPALSLPGSHKTDNSFIFKAIVTDTVEKRTIELAQTIQIEKDLL